MCLFSLFLLYQIIFKMVEENPRDVGHEMDELSIVYGDESLPRLYENSRISSDQLPGQSGKYFFIFTSLCLHDDMLSFVKVCQVFKFPSIFCLLMKVVVINVVRHC